MKKETMEIISTIQDKSIFDPSYDLYDDIIAIIDEVEKACEKLNDEASKLNIHINIDRCYNINNTVNAYLLKTYKLFHASFNVINFWQYQNSNTDMDKFNPYTLKNFKFDSDRAISASSFNVVNVDGNKFTIWVNNEYRFFEAWQFMLGDAFNKSRIVKEYKNGKMIFNLSLAEIEIITTKYPFILKGWNNSEND